LSFVADYQIRRLASQKSRHAISEFGAGVGELVGGGVGKAISSQQPQWITINPKPKDECFAESGCGLHTLPAWPSRICPL